MKGNITYMANNNIFLQNLLVDQKTINRINRLSILLGKRKYYIDNFKTEYFEHLKNEYNLIKTTFPNIDITPQARIKSEKSYYDKAVKVSESDFPKDIYDIFGNRYILNSINGSTNEKAINKAIYFIRDFLAYSFSDFENLNERTKDYIEHPKFSMYQSLHITRVHNKNSNKKYYSETQLRSFSMHSCAHTGIASHSKSYKKRIPGITKVPEQLEYVFDKNGFCIEVRDKSFEKSFEDFFGIPYNKFLYNKEKVRE